MTGKRNQLEISISGFLSVDENGILAPAIIKNLKNDCHFVNIDCTEKFNITPPPTPTKYGSSVFRVSTEMEY